LIDSNSSATASARGLAPRLPLPWMRTFTALSFHVAFADHEHGVHFHLLGPLDLPLL